MKNIIALIKKTPWDNRLLGFFCLVFSLGLLWFAFQLEGIFIMVAAITSLVLGVYSLIIMLFGIKLDGLLDNIFPG